MYLAVQYFFLHDACVAVAVKLWPCVHGLIVSQISPRVVGHGTKSGALLPSFWLVGSKARYTCTETLHGIAVSTMWEISSSTVRPSRMPDLRSPARDAPSPRFYDPLTLISFTMYYLQPFLSRTVTTSSREILPKRRNKRRNK